MEPRAFGVLYSVDHTGGWFVVTSNADGAKNFQLLVAPLASPGRDSWRPLPTASEGVEPFVYDPARMVRPRGPRYRFLFYFYFQEVESTRVRGRINA